MPQPKSAVKPRGTKPIAETKAIRGVNAATVAMNESPEVLTLAEAAAYLRVPEADVVRMVGPTGLPGRLIGSQWRFSKKALDQWLQSPPGPSTKEYLLALTGVR